MDYLEHHGIKGQKWGVIRTPEQLGHGSSGRKKINETENTHDDYRKARSKKVERMSDQELRESLNRLRMEEEYKKLNPSTVSKGEKTVKAAVATVTTLSAAAVAVITMKNSYDTIHSWFSKS